MSNQAHAAIVCKGSPAITEWRRSHPNTTLDLSDANFTDVELTGANLIGADLNQAIFNNAKLSRADLNDTNLTGAHFDGADLTDTHFSAADLYGVELTPNKINLATVRTLVPFGCINRRTRKMIDAVLDKITVDD